MSISLAALAFAGFCAFSFLLWRELKEDYPESWIFSLSLFAGGGALSGVFISKAAPPGLFFWITICGLISGVFISRISVKIRIGDLFDSLVPSSAVLISVIYPSYLFTNYEFRALYFIDFILTATSLFLFFYLHKNYKKFSWYLSGKNGFAGLATTCVYFYAKAAIVYFLAAVLLFKRFLASQFLLSLALAIILTVFLYRRSGRRD